MFSQNQESVAKQYHIYTFHLKDYILIIIIQNKTWKKLNGKKEVIFTYTINTWSTNYSKKCFH